jgi:hypothetical protein
MTTETLRRDTKDASNERRHTAECARAGAVARGELPSYEETVKARAIELWLAGYKDEARALVARELSK